jgi:hypothetical protein
MCRASQPNNVMFFVLTLDMTNSLPFLTYHRSTGWGSSMEPRSRSGDKITARGGGILAS